MFASMGPRQAATEKQRRLLQRSALLSENLKDPDQNVSAVARELRINRATAYTWWARFAVDTSLRDRERSGAPLKISKKEATAITRHVHRGKKKSIRTAAASLNAKRLADGKDAVSNRTVRRAAKRNPNLSYGPVETAKISAVNVARRRAATTQACIKQVKRGLYSFVFLDGAQIGWHKKTGEIKAFRINKEWNLAGDPRDPKLSGWVVVKYYGAFCVTASGEVHLMPIVIVDKSIDSDYITKVLFPKVHAFSKGVYKQRKFWVVQDGATPHTSKQTMAWVAKQGWQLHEHPAQSPDLNRIETLWLMHKQALERKRCKLWSTLLVHLEKSWQGIDHEYIRQTVRVLPEVMKVIHEAPEKLVSNWKKLLK